MKRYLLALAAITLAFSCSGQDKTKTDTDTKPEEVEETFTETTTLADKAELTLEEADEYTGFLKREWIFNTKKQLKSEYEKKILKIGSKSMPIHWTVYGNKPTRGRSLYISLHGGGGAPAATNDQQWNNQKSLYKPGEGVYLCPRAIDNTWDMHFMKGTDEFYERIISLAEAYFDVNPDRVYIMGYSAGGDGVWRLAPRMADHWAAASMMAGHPGDVSLVNLRNTPFMIWCGGDDTAYERNIRCQERIDEMTALHEADPEGYDFEGHILAGYGHWMELKDAEAVPWMGRRTRNPYPTRIVWQQEEGLREFFYWIQAPSSELSRGKKVIADLEDNTVTLTECDYTYLTLYFNDKMVDFTKPVKVVRGEDVLFEGMLKRSPETLRTTLSQRGDFSYMFPASVRVTL